jgi:hypothetical protein
MDCARLLAKAALAASAAAEPDGTGVVPMEEGV